VVLVDELIDNHHVIGRSRRAMDVKPTVVVHPNGYGSNSGGRVMLGSQRLGEGWRVTNIGSQDQSPVQQLVVKVTRHRLVKFQ
jgi:hypothetical protein